MSFVLLAALAAAAPAPATSSAYTPLDLGRCRVLRQAARGEGDWMNWRCPGYAGIPVLVHGDDGRFDLDAGTDNEEWESLSGFNRLGLQVEWRLARGRPFAVIYRLFPTDPSQDLNTMVAVETIGRPGRPGCQVAMIRSQPGSNVRARAIADRSARTFRCGADRPLTE